MLTKILYVDLSDFDQLTNEGVDKLLAKSEKQKFILLLVSVTDDPLLKSDCFAYIHLII